MKEYLGVDVPNDAMGVLQDVHWSEGLFGYFPDYLLGSVLSVQIWEKMRGDIPDLDEQISNGDLSALRAWLGENIHCSGSKFTPKETIERAVGGPLDPSSVSSLSRRQRSRICTAFDGSGVLSLGPEK